MENEDIVRELAEQGERIKVANKRIADLEEQQQRIQDLTLSVQELAISVRNMVEVQKEHSDKLAELEARPAQSCKDYGSDSPWNHRGFCCNLSGGLACSPVRIGLIRCGQHLNIYYRNPGGERR